MHLIHIFHVLTKRFPDFLKRIVLVKDDAHRRPGHNTDQKNEHGCPPDDSPPIHKQAGQSRQHSGEG